MHCSKWLHSFLRPRGPKRMNLEVTLLVSSASGFQKNEKSETGFGCEDTSNVVIFVGKAIRSRVTYWIGGDGIETSVTLYGEPAFSVMTCWIGGDLIGTLMIWCGENADIFYWDSVAEWSVFGQAKIRLLRETTHNRTSTDSVSYTKCSTYYL